MFWNKLLATFHRLSSRFKSQPEPIQADVSAQASGEQSREHP
jgi:hypothetical protein